MIQEKVHCAKHGLQDFGFLCIHLASSKNGSSVGFVSSKKRPKTVDFPFSDHYKNLVTQIKTTEISADCVLYNSVEAVNESKEFVSQEYWCFGGDGQGNRWLFDKNGYVFYYDHDYDEDLAPMAITFEQWLQMANLCQQMDECIDKDSFKRDDEKKFNETLNQIHPNLSKNFPYEI
ncbi:SMI1/KNR4 family protein [Sphingobacterium bovistauri]|uniref:SMI1/KNR4 family protein n=1 Tax=Sphingobacterium bovistauri TaxID=2781959 RepID=A0ABS7Z752_9SPHI|nr:SMI1/KNR4 family protein [Sphingobacterium bovistauri]MCA5005246.1 SMI1/KNR4 family protein [Sphingobacterium bovistauri]